MRIAQGDTQDRATPFIPPRASDPKMESFLGSDPMLDQWLEHRWARKTAYTFPRDARASDLKVDTTFRIHPKPSLSWSIAGLRKTGYTFPRDALVVVGA